MRQNWTTWCWCPWKALHLRSKCGPGHQCMGPEGTMQNSCEIKINHKQWSCKTCSSLKYTSSIICNIDCIWLLLTKESKNRLMVTLTSMECQWPTKFTRCHQMASTLNISSFRGRPPQTPSDKKGSVSHSHALWCTYPSSTLRSQVPSWSYHVHDDDDA